MTTLTPERIEEIRKRHESHATYYALYKRKPPEEHTHRADLLSAYDALSSRDAMREALAPFAKAAEMFAWPVAEPDSCAIAPGTKLTVGDLRRARDLLSPDAPRQKEEE